MIARTGRGPVWARVLTAAVCGAPSLAEAAQGTGDYPRGALPDGILVALLCGALIGVTWQRRKPAPRPAFPEWLRRSAARAVFMAAAYLLLRHAPATFRELSGHFDPGGAVSLLAGHFAGEAYRLFFLYVADAYLIAALALSGGYFYLHRGERHAEGDKYLACLRALGTPSGQSGRWNEAARCGALTVALKLVFVPYLTGWAIQSFQQAAAWFDAGRWDFYAVNRALVDGCILLDTVVFSAGYLIESRRFGSEIRAVDSSLRGWAVCLVCYPPFNEFVFAPFDRAWFDIAVMAGETTRQVFTAAVTLLWGVFAWASLSLGFKASNLTSRGVVSHGPYRFVRHPAYGAKLLIWYIQGVVFAEFSVGLLAALTAVYVLRAVSEERHLLATDPDYTDYRRRVRWRLVPRVV